MKVRSIILAHELIDLSGLHYFAWWLFFLHYRCRCSQTWLLQRWHCKVDYLISSYPEILVERPKLRVAKDIDLAIVSEMLVDRLIQEFGFDQSEYLLAGNVWKFPSSSILRRQATSITLPLILHLLTISKCWLNKLPAIAYARLHTEEAQKQETTGSGDIPPPRKGLVHPEAKCPGGKIYKDEKNVAYDAVMTMV